MCVIRMSAVDLHFAAEKGKKPTTAWQILHLFNLTTESTESFNIWQHFQEEANMGATQDLYP